MERLGIYIHIPFCAKKCDYCDFLSAPAGVEMQEAYIKALIREIKLSKDRMSDYLVDTVFIGGGTPSILDGKWIVQILETLKSNCVISEDVEISIECNPGTVTKEKLTTYKCAGINRLSFGLQSANNDELKSIGRIHSYEDFLESYYCARKCGFENINVDLMSALPGQTLDTYKDTLKKILALNPEHISAYSLIVEEGTPMKQRVEKATADGLDILPSEEAEREMYYFTKQMLSNAGYYRYEISNYAKQSYECKHNVGYWKRKDYLGFGIGAASLYKEERYNNISDINSYMEELAKDDSSNDLLQENLLLDLPQENVCKRLHIQENVQKLSKQEQMEEFMFLGLRMMDGVSVAQFENQFDVKYEDVYGNVTDKLIEQGLLEFFDEKIRLTEKGIDVSNYVMSEFLL